MSLAKDYSGFSDYLLQHLYATKKSASPADYDPNFFFGSSSNWIHYLSDLPALPRSILLCLGPKVTQSLFFMIDPMADLETNRKYAKVSAPNRTRISDYSGYSRSYSGYRRLVQTSNGSTALRPHPPISQTTSTTVFKGNLTASPKLRHISKDTTRKTRKPDEKFGEANFYQIRLEDPDRVINLPRLDSDIYVDLGPGIDTQLNLQRSFGTITVSPAGGRLTSSQATTIENNERSRATALLGQYGLSLYRQAKPEHRSFSAIREIAELKDLLASVHSSVEDVHLFTKGFKPDKLSSTYLNAKFGWAPIIQDLQRLLSLPDKIAKRVNYLLSRRGKMTTFRSLYKFTEQVTSPVGPTFDIISGESSPTQTTSGRRDVVLRCSLNASLDFPNVTIPELNTGLTRKFFGLQPTPTDVYNLIPWSWLADWVNGLDDYINVIDMAHNTFSIVNSCFLSVKLLQEVTTKMKVGNLTQETHDLSINGHVTHSPSGVTNYGSFIYRTTFYQRIDAVNLLSLDTPLSTPVVGTEKASILAALTFQRGGRSNSVWRN